MEEIILLLIGIFIGWTIADVLFSYPKKKKYRTIIPTREYKKLLKDEHKH